MEVDGDEVQVPTREVQAEMIRSAGIGRELEAKSKWFLVSQAWWSEWKAYVGYEDSPRGPQASVGERSLLAPGVCPGPIDNKKLLLDDSSEELVPRLVESVDYSLLPREAWELLHKWYRGGPEICRGVVRAGGMVGGVLQVEVYPLVLTVEKRCLGEAKSHELLVSKKESVRNLLLSICAMLWIPPTSTRLYLQTDRYEFTNLDDMKRSLDSYYIMSGQRVLVDAARFDGSYLGPPQRPLSALDAAEEDEENESSSGGENPYFRKMSGKYVSSTRGLGMTAMWKDSTEPAIEKGVTGLINLGNTCFMNSSIQCLSNVSEFSRVFLQEEATFSALLNRDNAMGTGGKLAEDFAELLRKIWSGNYSYVAPKNLKYTLGDFAPQFSGYRQQDAQELLAFLLDGLHEDLNEVVAKPYFSDQLIYSGSDVEGPEAVEVGKESWNRHLARNKSKIVDLFDGLLRSRLHCPSCDRLSVTFDPFRYLSVPIPDADKCYFDVTFVPSSHLARPKKYRVETTIHSTVKDLHRELSRMTGVPFGSILFANESRGSIRSFVRSDSKGIGALESYDTILAFEALSAPVDYDEGAKLPVDSMDIDSGEAEEASGASRQESLEARIPEGHHLLQFLFRRMVSQDEEGHEERGSPEMEVVSLPLVRSVSKSVKHSELMETVERYLSLFGAASTRERSDTTARKSPKSASEAKYSFSLRTVSGNGRRCAVCGPSSSCFGCPLEDVRGEELKNGQSIAVDLHSVVNFCETEMDESVLDATGAEEETSPSLEQCLELFSQEEVLQGGQEWFCPRCKKHVNAAKKLDVWKWPTVLVIHLKRFYHLQGSNKRGKVEKEVRFPDVLECGGGHYPLVAVSNHMGGIGGGHYTAYARNEVEGRWYDFNDRQCCPVDAADVHTPNAYILYFVRR